MQAHEDLLEKAASLYYEDGLTQADIARRVFLSRSTVSRLLEEARQIGVVEIKVNRAWRRSSDLEQQLIQRFHLRNALVLVVNEQEYQRILRSLGVLAARYLEGILVDGMIVGVDWGMGVYYTVRALRPQERLSITVVQMTGTAGRGDPLTDGPDLARVFASTCGGQYRYLPVPLLVESPSLRKALLQESSIGDVLSLARKANVALVAIGSLDPEVSGLLRAGYVDRDTLLELRARGAVGSICGRLFDVQGRVVNTEMNERVIGIDFEELHSIEQVIGVTGGERKAEAILGALRGGHVNVIMTDETAATRVLALDAQG